MLNESFMQNQLRTPNTQDGRYVEQSSSQTVNNSRWLIERIETLEKRVAELERKGGE